ncbi:unnamed protein product [Lactuca saligna]|uniref:Uncharacterized protein n=1 Tax=Lactuca saligna TaxID=75948 RepID=A0AA35YEB7_LACSI|nr:unnamed protein product [Lactuca saligna]
MAASLFTFSSTSRRVIPAPNSPPLPIYIKATNVVFNPDIPEVHRGLGLDDFANFLASCRLRYAISDVPSEFFPEQVYEFYYIATVNDADDNVDNEPNDRDTEPVDNTTVQPESPKPMHESDSAGHNSPAATEKLVEDSEHDEEHDEPDDECQILDMNFINPLIPVQEESLDDLEESHPLSVDLVADPIVPVQGEDLDVASEESHPLSRKRKASSPRDR